jgi:predicted RNA binding protein YcfA (HicA-like mRNA interferase family)
MKSLSYKKLIGLLETKGFVVSRKKGSHIIFKNSTTGKIVPVPLHGKNNPIPVGTFLAILKQARIDKKDIK